MNDYGYQLMMLVNAWSIDKQALEHFGIDGVSLMCLRIKVDTLRQYKYELDHKEGLVETWQTIQLG
jgi:hypothetical protein